MNMLAQMSLMQWFLALLMIAVCGLLMLIVLIQRGRGQGLSGAFGGGGGGGAFGAKTGDVFTWITVGLAVFFLFLNVIGIFVFDQTPAVATPVPENVEIPIPEPVQPTTGESAGAPITIEGTTESGDPIEIPVGGPFDSAEDAGEAAGQPSDEGRPAP